MNQYKANIKHEAFDEVIKHSETNKLRTECVSKIRAEALTELR